MIIGKAILDIKKTAKGEKHLELDRFYGVISVREHYDISLFWKE